jgi:AraC-like DNA-binding protein
MVKASIGLPRPDRPATLVRMDMPPIRVVRHESESGSSHELAHRPPKPELRTHLSRYCGYVERTPGLLRRRELPTADITLIIGFEQELRVASSAQPAASVETHDSFVAGIAESAAVTEFTGCSQGIEVNLTPFGARMLLGVPMHDLANRVVRLDDVLGDEGHRLPEQLFETRGWEARFQLLDSFVAERVTRARPPSPALVWAWRRLLATDGRIGIGELARELRCSRRYLVTQFRDYVGLPPKSIARILRFRRALAEIERDDGRRFAEIAQACGYYDQAHLNRDFRDFCGITPSELVARRLPAGLGLAA